MYADLERDCQEYIDGLTSVELAMLMAIKYKESPAHAIRRCARKVSRRLRTPLVRQVFKNISVHHSPMTAITTLRTSLDNLTGTPYA